MSIIIPVSLCLSLSLSVILIQPKNGKILSFPSPPFISLLSLVLPFTKKKQRTRAKRENEREDVFVSNSFVETGGYHSLYGWWKIAKLTTLFLPSKMQEYENKTKSILISFGYCRYIYIGYIMGGFVYDFYPWWGKIHIQIHPLL